MASNPEDRVLEAFYALVVQRVQRRLPATQRGIRAAPDIKARVPQEVVAALEQIVTKIAAEVGGEVEHIQPFAAQVCETCGGGGLEPVCPSCGRKG